MIEYLSIAFTSISVVVLSLMYYNKKYKINQKNRTYCEKLCRDGRKCRNKISLCRWHKK